MDKTASLFTITLTLFIMMDPLGNISSFLTMMKGISYKRQFYVLCREMFIALLVMFVFFLIGDTVIHFLEISDSAVWLSSGVILFLTAIKILFPPEDALRHNLPEGEPFIVPFAIPLIAGPSLLATIMLFSHMEACRPMMVTAIFLSWMAAMAVLVLAPQLKRLLGANGLNACERLTGMVLVMIAIQRFMEGIRLVIADAQY
jgi:multiple antibiotic resistance protein